MKKYFVLFCLIALPFTLSAQILVADKSYLLRQANSHRNQAIAALYEAEEICWYIPDLGKRKHLKAIFEGCAASMFVPNPIYKIMAVGSPLIATLCSDAYDEFCELRECMARSAHNFEMANFYTELALHVSCDNMGCFQDADKGTKAFINAINYMVLCEALANSIQDKWERTAVLNHLTYQRELLLKEVNNASKSLTKKISPDAWGFYENLDEILADVEDDVLKEEMIGYAYTVAESLDEAEAIWGIK